MNPVIETGTVHETPNDIEVALLADRDALELWNKLTPLARNEWICWTISVKKEETRKDHVARLTKHLKEGKKRPCCWIGCIHRDDKEISPSIKGILEKRNRKSAS